MSIDSREPRLLGRLASFGALPMLSMAAPFVLLPVISRVGGPTGWVAVLTGQAIGSFAGVVVMAGWAVHGQASVAVTTDPEARSSIYRESLWTRTRLAVVGLPVAMLVSAVVVDGSRVDAAVMALANGLAGLSMSWYATGAGRASWIARYDAGPRCLAVVLAAPTVVITRQLWTYPALVVVGALCGLIAFNLRHTGVVWPVSRRGTASRRDDLRGGFVSVVGNLYASAPVPIGAVRLASPAAAALGSADKLYRYGTLVVVALANGFQAWALEPTSPQRRSRLRTALIWHAAFGLLALVAMLVVGSWGTRFLFGADVAAPRSVCALYGVALAAVSISTTLIRNHAVPLGRLDLVVWATAVSALAGVACMLVLHGAAGVAAGLAGSEVLCCVVLAAGLATRRRDPEEAELTSGAAAR